MNAALGLHVVHSIASLRADHGGPARSVTSLCSELARYGKIELVTLRRRHNEAAPLLPESSVNVQLIPFTRMRPLAVRTALMPALRRALKGPPHECAILHDHGIWLSTNHAAAIVARQAQVRRVVSPRGMLSQWALNAGRLKKRIAWAFYQRRDLETASLIHVTSHQEADEVRAVGLTAPIAIIANGVNVPRHVEPRIRTDDRRTALFLSRIHPKKGILNLIRAWSLVRPPNWKLTIAGPDDKGHSAEVKELATQEGIAEDVQFTGSVEDADKWRVYADADLFVLPTFSENFGLVIAEALGSGLPVITTTGTPWSALAADRCGWWIEPAVEPLAAALQSATSMSDQERAQMGARGRALVQDQYSWQKAAREMFEAYRWLLGDADPASFIVNSRP
ncbi:MAG: glycosyltransferase [Gemmatimonadaceae bacterium]